MEADSNTFTVVLRVVGDDENGTQYPGVQLGHPVPGDVNTETWPWLWEITIRDCMVMSPARLRL
jgi:hypothetical protein